MFISSYSHLLQYVSENITVLEISSEKNNYCYSKIA